MCIYTYIYTQNVSQSFRSGQPSSSPLRHVLPSKRTSKSNLAFKLDLQVQLGLQIGPPSPTWRPN